MLVLALGLALALSETRSAGNHAGAGGHAADHPAGGRRVHLALPAQFGDRLHRRLPAAGRGLHRQPARRSHRRLGLGGDRRRLEPHAVHVPDLPRGAAEHPAGLLRGGAGRRRRARPGVLLRDAADDQGGDGGGPPLPGHRRDQHLRADLCDDQGRARPGHPDAVDPRLEDRFPGLRSRPVGGARRRHAGDHARSARQIVFQRFLKVRE